MTIAGNLSMPYFRLVLVIEHEVLLDDGDLVVEAGDLVEDRLATGPLSEPPMAWVKSSSVTGFVMRRGVPSGRLRLERTVGP